MIISIGTLILMVLVLVIWLEFRLNKIVDRLEQIKKKLGADNGINHYKNTGGN